MRYYLSLLFLSIAFGFLLLNWPGHEAAVHPQETTVLLTNSSDESQSEIPLATTPVRAPADLHIDDFAQESLLALKERYGYDERPDALAIDPLMEADMIARDNSYVHFPSAYDAIVNSLSNARAAEVIECMRGNLYGSGGANKEWISGASKLAQQQEQKSMPWEPMGKYWAEQMLMYGSYSDEFSESKFCSILLERHLVDTPFSGSAEHPIELGSEINPDGKTLTEDQWGIISFVMNDHESQIRDAILFNGLYSAQLAARKGAVAKGLYEAVPGLAFGTIEECDSMPREMLSVRGSYAANGWALYITIQKGAYPELDLKLGELQNAVDLRNSQVAAYIASF